MNKKVVVGMSGGVDSSVAAYLLKEQGMDVIGVTMRTWKDNKEDDMAVTDAKRVAKQLNIPHYTLDFRPEFKKYVMDYFANEYLMGRTPNPCVVCNRFVKWQMLLSRTAEYGCEYVATGHYAAVDKYPATGRFVIKESLNAAKDQTYALYNLTQEQLMHTIMPIGVYKKEDVRAIAEKAGLEVAKKADSQDICFVPDNDYVGFLKRNYGYTEKAGNFVDMQGHILGRHRGIANYTVGQRKGLGLACGKHVYVNQLRPDTNEVVISDNESLFKTKIYADKLNLMAVDKLDGEVRLTAKIRYAHKKSPCTVKMVGDILECTFDEPQRAPAPGQAIVLYDGSYVYGGGTIIKGE